MNTRDAWDPIRRAPPAASQSCTPARFRTPPAVARGGSRAN